MLIGVVSRCAHVPCIGLASHAGRSNAAPWPNIRELWMDAWLDGWIGGEGKPLNREKHPQWTLGQRTLSSADSHTTENLNPTLPFRSGILHNYGKPCHGAPSGNAIGLLGCFREFTSPPHRLHHREALMTLAGQVDKAPVAADRRWTRPPPDIWSFSCCRFWVTHCVGSQRASSLSPVTAQP